MFSKKTALVILFPAAQLFAAATLQPAHLRCEYRVDPQGIDVTQPRLSWQLTAANPKLRGLRQSAYRIVVASSQSQLAANAYDLWDSGKVESSESAQLVYRGKPLDSGGLAAWKVQVWDQAGEAGKWSGVAQWTMGLLRKEDWQGKWIGRDEPGNYRNPDSPYRVLEGARWIWGTPDAPSTVHSGATAGDRYFRATITVPAGRKVRRAICIAASDSRADIFLNGAPLAVSSGPLPPIVDLAGLLHPGDNLLAIHAVHVQATPPQAERPAGAIASVRVEFDSGDPLLLQSGNGWFTAAKVEDGWEKPGYLDVAWRPSVELGSYGMPPWGALGITAEHRLPARMLRKEFTLEKKMRRATIHFSGLGLSELYVNGAKVDDHVLSPGLTDYDKHVLYVTYEVTRHHRLVAMPSG